MAVWAEVCDKERPNWSPDDVAVGLFGEAIGPLMTPFGGLALVTALLGLWSGWRVLCSLGLTLMALILLGTGFEVGMTFGWLMPDTTSDIYFAVVNEGCRASPIIAAILAAMLTLGCALRMTIWRPPLSA